MKITTSKIIFAIITVLLLASVFTFAAFAATPGSGYCVNDDGVQTNIKYTMTADGVLTFEIDPTATDKVQTTVLYNKDPVDGSVGYWGGCLTTFAGTTKVIIGDGITELNCLMYQKAMKQVEIPASLTVLGESAFQTGHGLESVYIRGTEPVKGLYDLSNITSMDIYCFDDCKSMTSVKLNPDLASAIPVEGFKCTSLEEIEIPAGVTEISKNAFMMTSKLRVVTVLGMETTFASDEVFADNETYPAIKAKAGSKAAEFAKANGYTFIDLDTGETTKGTKSTTTESSSSGGTTAPAVTDFKPEGATLWGHSTGMYETTQIINTWWAYYDSTKTLEFVSATTSYNETGDLTNVDDGYTDWSAYKDQIEHIIVGDNITKISGHAFSGYKALKDVRVGNKVTQIDYGAFINCENLTTIWKNGSERVEGKADFSNLSKMNEIITGTKINEAVLPKAVKELDVILPPSIKTIYAHEITDQLIQYAKENLFNLQSLTDPSVKHEYYVYVDPTLPVCGPRSVFSFDAATGTLTVHGAGVIDDIINYYGGGSKTQPWFEIKNQVKHIVISDGITSIGKYAFCEFVNLETVQIPASESFAILNAAFEKCSSLRSVYRAGNEPIEGTLDLRNVSELNSWTFAYDYLIANVIISPEVTKIGTSVFEENITVNLANVYGTPGSYAETYASENGLTFYDIAANTPAPITCTIPETTDTTEAPETTLAPETTAEPETTAVPESNSETVAESAPDTVMPIIKYEDDAEESPSNILPIIIVVAVVVVAAAAVAIIIAAKKKKSVK